MAGLYLHIPFCKQACYYCDFHFSTNQTVKEELVNAMANELRLQKDYLLGEAVETIYLGGGTPSLLSEKEFAFLFESIYQHFQVTPFAEITLEANPDDITPEKIKQLKQVGINRISLGIQSFNDEVLAFLNRAHNSVEAEDSVALLRDSGFTNISIDLIHSIPNQNKKVLIENLEKAWQLKPEHISVYSLTLEEKTVFGKWHVQGKLKATDESESAEQFELVMDTLVDKGYQHYEISNFSLPGFASKHNSSYWHQKKYLGIGPSAHSYDLVSRQSNVSNNHLYIKTLKENQLPFEREVLTTANKINEYIFTSLRTDSGCHIALLCEQFGYNLMDAHSTYIKYLLDKEYVSLTNEILSLTRSGKLFADKIASDLFTSIE